MLKYFHQQSQKMEIDIPTLIDEIRAYAISKYISPTVLKLCEKNKIPIPQKTKKLLKYSSYFEEEAKKWWHSYVYHLSNRLEGIKDFDIFLKLFPQYKTKKIKLRKYLENSYDLSILPLNLSKHLKNAVKNHLPEIGFISKQDPYGIKNKKSVILDKNERGTFYVATRKPKYATYLFVLTVPWAKDPTKGTFMCPIGCKHCYRGFETRHKQNIKIIKKLQDIVSSRISEQSRSLAKKWKEEIYDILVSGGEPLLFNNKTWKEDIVDIIKHVPHLYSFRICTGALALGLFARIDNELLRILTNMRDEYGIQIGFNIHIAHWENLTPEMIEKAYLLQKHNIRIMPQIPLVEGVNFWNHDLDKTIETIRKTSRLCAFVLNEPVYKYILDMQGSVSLLQAIKVYRYLFDRHQEESNIIRPISFELFTSHDTGNMNLSYHTLYAIQHNIDKKKKEVIYTIPHPAGTKIIWKEKLLKGINDKIGF